MNREINCLCSDTGETKKLQVTEAALLTYDEAKLLSEEERIVPYTTWWLMTPGEDERYYPEIIESSHEVMAVRPNGKINREGCWVDDPWGVRPSLVIKNLRASGMKVGDHFESGGLSWKIVTPTCAVANDCIAERPYRENYRASNATEYIYSDISNFLSDWLEEFCDKQNTSAMPREEKEYA